MTTANERSFSEKAARIIPYPAIQHHGVIGDRRTAALVSADGTIDWLCLPDFDGAMVFGGLLDWLKGGHWKFGPARMHIGMQRYLEHSAVLETQWTLPEGTLILTDAMAWPGNDRAADREPNRVVVRRLRCTRGNVGCRLDFQPRYMFEQRDIALTAGSDGVRARVRDLDLLLWSSIQCQPVKLAVQSGFELSAGEEAWAIMEVAPSNSAWSIGRADEALQETLQYWRHWLSALKHHGARQSQLERAAITVHLLTYAPLGSQVAAATTSLPESVGGSWNADYRYSWIRDSSLACAALTWLGDWGETERYLKSFTTITPGRNMPFQVLYGIHGETRPKQRTVRAAGYRHSRPVRLGNHAYRQIQISALGYLADCALNYLDAGGSWATEYGNVIRTIADYTATHWHQRDNSLWELNSKKHYVSSKVMSWVALDRALKIMRKTGDEGNTSQWENARDAIRQEVLSKGWSDRLGAFRQHYQADNLDSAALLIPIMGLLPPHDSRVLSTIDRIAEQLTIDQFAFRFNPYETASVSPMPLGELEGAFLPCTFWLAAAYALTGRPEKALAILERVEKVAGELSLFAEAVDPRTRGFLGNTPLLFSHVEYVRAVLALQQSQTD